MALNLLSSINVDYTHWKERRVDNFADLTPVDKCYFEIELKEYINLVDIAPQILEIGFGNGKFLQYCTSRKWSITGTEINPLLIEIAQAKGFHAVLSENLIELADEQFDQAVACDALEHILQEQIIFS